jgi:hypothetical protein
VWAGRESNPMVDFVEHGAPGPEVSDMLLGA